MTTPWTTTRTLKRASAPTPALRGRPGFDIAKDAENPWGKPFWKIMCVSWWVYHIFLNVS